MTNRGVPSKRLILGMLLAIAAWQSSDIVFDIVAPRPTAVPQNHFVAQIAGDSYVVGRGGGPIESRPKVRLRPEEVRAWQLYEQRKSTFNDVAGLGFWLTVAVLAWLEFNPAVQRSPNAE